MFSARRSKVASRSTDGKAVNSTGFLIRSDVISTRIEKVIEIASNRSSRIGGSGTSMMQRMPSTTTASAISPRMSIRGRSENWKLVPCGWTASVMF